MNRSPLMPLSALRLSLCLAVVASFTRVPTAPAQVGSQPDPRVGLAGGHWVHASEAINNLELVAHLDKPAGYMSSANRGDLNFASTDLAFRGNYVFQGNGQGVLIWDFSDPAHPSLKSSTKCPEGQGDVSVYGNFLLVSTEGPSGRLDCGSEGVRDSVSPERMRGVRIYDVSDIEHPKLVANVQTCRGSHTHTPLPDPTDKNVFYVYVQGISPVRPASELAGCSGLRPEQDPNTSLFRIEVIRVPVNAPQDAKVIAAPRIFADLKTGAVNGLAKKTHGDTLAGVQATAETDQCHDITVYPAIGLAGGACSGNGILLDIRKPAEPKRIAEMSDPNFAYWHSATFNNDGTRVVFTDEWGGGFAPRCRASDPPKWGANAIFTITAQRKLELNGYFKLPAAQTALENCVAHNGNLIPVPGRDIMVQAWYQGGISVFDFTDPAHPTEIAYFDRGPLDSQKLLLGGYWGAYWYNGRIYGSEIGLGLDVFALKPSEYLTQSEIDAAQSVRVDESTPASQQKVVWPASFVVARAYLDQLDRSSGLTSESRAALRADLDKAEQMQGAERRRALTSLARKATAATSGTDASDRARVRGLAAAVRDLANAGGPSRAAAP